VTTIARLFLCSGCGASIDPARVCAACGKAISRHGSIYDVLADRAFEGRALDVNAFYERRPFPGYGPGDGAHSLLDRSRRSPFLVALDRAVPPDATVLDCGSGTAQVAAFLALSAPRRTVIAADGCRASLATADEFRSRAGIDNLHLVRANLFELPLARRAFDVVVCRGVVHHTPRPWEAIQRVSEHVADGGHFVLGFYESAGRLVHHARRALSKVVGREIHWIDPVLRRRDLDPEKKTTWIEDQYRHPLERSLSVTDVARALESCGFEWVRSVPPAPSVNELFSPTPRLSRWSALARRASWAASGFGDEDAGLVSVVARARSRA
jgi:SAM-dependent methyltransferase